MNFRNKFILLFHLLILLLVQRTFGQRPKLNVEISILGFDTTSKCTSDNKIDTVYLLQINIINESNKEVKFGHMSCDWILQFDLKKGSIHACDWGCDKNSPTITTIKAGMQHTFGIFIKRNLNSEKEIQLLFYFVPDVEFFNYGRKDLRKNSKEIIFISNVCKVESNNRVKFFYKEEFQEYLRYKNYFKNYLK